MGRRTGDEAVALQARGIKRAFSSGFELAVLEMDLRAGCVTAVLGPSGSGKSTLLNILGLLEPPDEGRVLLDGSEVTRRDHEARRRVAAVFQRPYLFKGTVADNVAYGLKLRRVPGPKRRAAVDAVLARVGLDGWGGRSAPTLSGGEAQRVALARALVLEPRVLLLDEPLASLDAALKAKLARAFRGILRDAGVTTLYVTHDQDEAMVVADDVAVMRDGRIVAHGHADEVMSLPRDEWMAAFLGLEPSLRGLVVEVRDGLARIDCLGVDVFATIDRPPRTPVLLSVRPEDVLVFEGAAELPLSSARNRIHGTVAELTPAGSTYRAVIEAGELRLAASVSRSAAAELGLRPGSPVLAVFKATAVRVADVPAGGDTREGTR